MLRSDRSLAVIAPFANERIREWPTGHFRRFVELSLRDEMRVVIVGTAGQRSRANSLVREFAAPDVLNACGRMNWPALRDTIGSAAYVVANNSGVAHVAASLNKWTLCIFAASHSWIEWMPRGPRVVTIALFPPCAPCEIGDGDCPNGLMCMNYLEADTVYGEFREKWLAGKHFP